MPLVSIVIPAYDEASNVAEMMRQLDALLNTLRPRYSFEVIFVNDGSRDNTLQVLKTAANAYSYVYYVSFSRNFGQTNALRAGLDYASGACMISLDCDLQHPLELIPTLIEQWQAGYEVVMTLRKEDTSLSFWKRFSSKIFHKIISKISDVEVLYGESDFRLIDQKVVQVIRGLREKDLFWRGIVKWAGFRQTTISYTPNARYAGHTSYTWGSLLRLASKNIFSFGVRPLYLIAMLGLVFIGISLLYLPYIVYSFMNNIAVSGWTSTIMVVLFFAGINLLTLGVLSIYFAEMFMQLKGRPHYVVDECSLDGEGNVH